jgi:TetR/AcrR family transcriptional regulator, transcriptional repressor of bet genes
VPKLVDHDARRRELADAAIRVIGRDGLERASIRSIAAEAGWTTGVLQHYFDTKDQLLDAALDEIEHRTLERFIRAQTSEPARAAIEGAVHSLLGLDDDCAAVWVAFMARGCVEATTARRWRRAERLWVTRWAELVMRGQSDGSIDAELDPTETGRAIHAMVSGLRVSALLGTPADPDLATRGILGGSGAGDRARHR